MLSRLPLLFLLAIEALGCDALRVDTWVDGRVVDDGRKPIEKVIVKLVAVSYDPVLTAPEGRLPPSTGMKAIHRPIGYGVTDENGRFNFEKVDLLSGPSACKFIIVTTKPGYEDDSFD